LHQVERATSDARSAHDTRLLVPRSVDNLVRSAHSRASVFGLRRLAGLGRLCRLRCAGEDLVCSNLASRPSSVPRRGSNPIFCPFVLMRCHSAGEIGCFDVSAGFSFPHLYRSPDFDGRPRFSAMMQTPCPWSYAPIPRIVATMRACDPQACAAVPERITEKKLHESPLAQRF
jgi:hypothetical protein